MKTERTNTKTLWSETQHELLYMSIQKNRPVKEIIDILRDLRDRGFSPKQLVDKVQDKVGMTSANRLKKIIKDANL